MRLTDDNSRVIGFSLRLGTNISFCHPKKQKQHISTYREINDEVILWNWKEEELDFGYPLEVSSSVYRTSLLKNLCQKLTYRNPNTFEHQLDLYKDKLFKSFPWLLSYKTSRSFCLPMNLTQNEYKNRHSQNTRYSIDSLLNIYAQGKKMNVRSLYDKVINSPHVEMEYTFIARNNK